MSTIKEAVYVVYEKLITEKAMSRFQKSGF